MNKKMRLAPMFMAVIMMFSSTASLAAGGDVTPGTLNFTSSVDAEPTEGTNVSTKTSGIEFATVGEIDVDSTIPVVADTDYIRMDDNRGTGVGWNVKVSATDLVATVADATDVAAGDIVVTIPVETVLTGQVANLASINSSILTGLTINTTITPMDTTGIQIMGAASSCGAGAYYSDVTYTLSLPNYLPTGSTVVPANPDTSDYDEAVVTDLGILAGSYSTTVTYAIASAPL